MGDTSFVKPQYFHRERIDKLLDEVYEKQILFITAPMGYGKTTMVRKFLERKNPEVSEWFYFGKMENDITWFWKQINSLYQKNEYYAQATRETYLNNDQFEIMEFVSLLEKIVIKETVCIFEDYHLSNHVIANKVLEAIAYANIPKLHFIIIGRFFPEMPYLEMKMKGSCEIIEEQELRLTKEETQQFFEENGCELTEEKIEDIYQYTDGWMAAAYLVCMNYMQNGDISANRSVSNLIRTSIFQKLTEKEQQILEKLCWAPYCTPEQANFLTDNDYAASLLFDMEKRIGFIHYFDTKGFSFHSMLQTVAKEEAIKHGIREHDFLEKNVAWYMQQKEFINASVTYAKMEKYEEIFELLETENMFAIFQESLTTFFEIFKKVPLELKLDFINVYTFFISIYIMRHDYYEGIALYQEIKPYLAERRLPTEDDIMMCNLAMLENIYNFNDVNAMARASVPILEKMSDQARAFYELEIDKLFAVPDVLRVLHYKKGSMCDELKEANQKVENASTNYELEIQSDNLIFLAEHAYETGNIKKAMAYAEKMYLRGKYQRKPMVFIAAAYVLLHCHVYLGQHQQGKMILTELEKLMPEYKQEIFQQDYDLLIASIYGSLQSGEHIKKWIRDIDLKRCSFVIKLSGTAHCVYAKFLCSEKKYVALEIIAEEMLKNIEKETFVFKDIFGNMFLAIAKYHNDEEQEAIEILEKLLKKTEADHIIMAYVENAMEVYPVIQKVKKNPYVEEVLQSCKKCLNSIDMMGFALQSEVSVEKSILTSREQEVMEQVAMGKKNAEIAETLHIARITVEKTLSNIYRKFGVKNRAGALLEYQKL